MEPLTVVTDASARSIPGDSQHPRSQILSFAYHFVLNGEPITGVETEVLPGRPQSDLAELKAVLLALRVLHERGYDGPVLVKTDLLDLARALQSPDEYPDFPYCRTRVDFFREHLTPHMANFRGLQVVKVPRQEVTVAHNAARDASDRAMGRKCRHSEHQPNGCYGPPRRPEPPTPSSTPSRYRSPPILPDIRTTWDEIRHSRGGATIADLLGEDRVQCLLVGTNWG